MKGYLASNFFDLAGFDFTDRLANIIEKCGVDCYVPQYGYNLKSYLPPLLARFEYV